MNGPRWKGYSPGRTPWQKLSFIASREKETSERGDDNYSVVFQGCEYTQKEKIVSGETKWQYDFLSLSNEAEEFKLESMLTMIPVSQWNIFLRAEVNTTLVERFKSKINM